MTNAYNSNDLYLGRDFNPTPGKISKVHDGWSVNSRSKGLSIGLIMKSKGLFVAMLGAGEKHIGTADSLKEALAFFSN